MLAAVVTSAARRSGYYRHRPPGL